MKNLSLVKLALIVLAAIPTLSQAGFLDNLEGQYRILEGKKCKMESASLTGKAAIKSDDSGATVYLEVRIAYLKTEIPVSFLNGSGNKKSTKMEGDILPLPIARKIVWATNESTHESVKSEYEGIAFPKLTGTYSLKENNDGSLRLRLENSGAEKVECILQR